MKSQRFFLDIGPPKSWGAVLLLGFALVLWGCQAQEPPLSKAAANFKSEVKECIATVSGSLTGPVMKKDKPAINAALKKCEPQAVKLCRMCPFKIAVLDAHGDALAVYPPQENSAGNFSGYELVSRVMSSRKAAQKRFYLQNGSRLFIICTPLLKEEKVVGILAISLNADEAQQRWGITEPEFLSLDFNK